jgi:uncharacterized protein YjeT (DUF2065 family)
MKIALLGFIDLLTYLERPTVIIGLICLVVGTSLALLAGRIAVAFDKTSVGNVPSKLESTLKIIGVCVLTVGFILIAIPS